MPLTRRGLLGSIAAGLVLLVTGCASGTSREAERGRNRDAERTSVVDDMQRTATSRLILGSPEASPDPDDE